jgi:urease accessory protein
MPVLQLFKPLPIAREVFRENTLPAAAGGYRRDTVVLGWEERLKSRSRRLSAGGLEFGTTLPRGTILRAGDCFVLDDIGAVVVVVDRDEPVFVIEPVSPDECGLFAYHIGNSHQPMMICGGRIICPDVPGMQRVLDQHGIAFSRATRPFTPIGLVPDHRH